MGRGTARRCCVSRRCRGFPTGSSRRAVRARATGTAANAPLNSKCLVDVSCTSCAVRCPCQREKRRIIHKTRPPPPFPNQLGAACGDARPTPTHATPAQDEPTPPSHQTRALMHTYFGELIAKKCGDLVEMRVVLHLLATREIVSGTHFSCGALLQALARLPRLVAAAGRRQLQYHTSVRWAT